ncbi:MAG: COX15/CtaA family protein [Pseudomonadota bacterium]
MKALRLVAGGTLVLTYGLIVLGAWVRATGSGLSCPDWPTCYGYWVPLPSDIPPDVGYSYFQVMLEWVHRLIAGVIVGPLVLLIGVLAWRVRHEQPRMPGYAATLIALLIIQAGIGGLTVFELNSPWSVALHLGTALVLLSVLCLIYVRAGPALSSVVGPARAISGLVWLVALGTMVSAAMVTKSGASLACTSWPLCGGPLVPDFADPQIRLHMIHRLFALGLGIGVLALALVMRSQVEVRSMASLVLILVAIEIGLGGMVVLGEIPFGLALLHQATGVLIFAILSLILWQCYGLTSETEIAHGLSHA